MKGKKYHKSTETVRDQAKKDLVGHHVRRLFEKLFRALSQGNQ